jgi:hypothetical protein
VRPFWRTGGSKEPNEAPSPTRAPDLNARQRADEGACVTEHQFKFGRTRCGTAFAHRLKCRINLTDRSLGHGEVPAPLRKEHQRYPFIAKARRPIERHPVASPFRQRFAMG